MNETLVNARNFILTNARLLERRLFQVYFEGDSPDYIGQIIRAYQNSDGGLGHTLEPDIRCPESQPIFVGIGLEALEEADCRDIQLAKSLCNYLKSVSAKNGLVPCLQETAYQSPIANHWINATIAPGLNPTAEICGLLHYQRVQHDWLLQATETCCKMIINDPPREAHTLYGASRLAQYLPDRAMAMNLLDKIGAVLPKARFFIPGTPVKTYGLTPLHFAPKPNSICRAFFTQDQIDGHLEYLMGQQQADGGWPISWEAPGPASECEWRGRWTLDAICRLTAYGRISKE
jgi:hypothetical protein